MNEERARAEFDKAYRDAMAEASKGLTVMNAGLGCCYAMLCLMIIAALFVVLRLVLTQL
jgi:hypothetical protein